MSAWEWVGVAFIVGAVLWRLAVIEDRLILTFESARRIEAYLGYRPRVPPKGCESHNMHGVLAPGEACPGCARVIRRDVI